MSDPVSYTRKDSIAVISMDDGKVNALGPAMQQALMQRSTTRTVMMLGRW